jgi:hypothetical protein
MMALAVGVENVRVQRQEAGMKFSTLTALMAPVVSLVAVTAFSAGSASATGKLVSIPPPRVSRPHIQAPAINSKVMKSNHDTASSPVQNVKN